MYDGTIEFHFELCKTNEQNANTRDAHLFYGTRILPDSIENNRWIQINRKEIGHKPDTSQMKKRPICIGVFSGNQIDWISQFSQFQQYLNILRCVWIGTGSFLRSELNWKCKLSTWLLRYTVRWKYCLVQASSRYLVGRWISLGRLNSGIFMIFEPWKRNLNLNAWDCRASKIIRNDSKLEPISWERRKSNFQVLRGCLGRWTSFDKLFIG